MTAQPYSRDFGLIETLVARYPQVRRLAATALATRAPNLRSALAYAASGGAFLYPDLVERLDGSELVLRARPAAALARVLALQQSGTDRATAASILDRLALGRLESADLMLRAQLAFVLGDFERCEELVRRMTADEVPGSEFVATDLANPFVRSSGVTEVDWARRFAAPFVAANLEPPVLGAASGTPFDRMTCDAGQAIDGPLVSVVVTTYRPGPSLVTAVRSVLSQTWSSLDVIVVDDASGPTFGEVLDEVAGLDDRITIIRRRENQGTYACRNAAIDIAKGVYVTGQDDDDWSHPRRIERQMAALLEQGGDGAVRAGAIRATDLLTTTQPGRSVMAPLSPTYLVRRDVVLRAGCYLPARKGADTELMRRIEAMTGLETVDLADPLAVYRLTPASLSRDDFAPGWRHPARSAFWSSAALAHAAVRSGTASAQEAMQQLAVPRRYAIEPREQALDVVFVADWSAPDARPRLLPEVHDAVRAGCRTALLHVPDAVRGVTGTESLDLSVQTLVNDGTVDQVFTDDPIGARNVVVLTPSVLHFLPPASSLHAAQGAVIVDHAPSGPQLERIGYVPVECHAAFRHAFGSDLRWIARDPVVRARLTPTLRSGLVEPDCRPHSVAGQAPVRPAPPRTSLGPVVGRAVGHPHDWATDALPDIYRTDEYEVRLLGDVPAALIRRGRVPGNVVVFPRDELPTDLFLSQLHFYVDMVSPEGSASWVRSAAMAAGCVVILPPEMRDLYGDAASYARPDAVLATVLDLYERPDEMARRGAKAQRFVQDLRAARGSEWLE